MKLIINLSLMAALSVPFVAYGQADSMKGMDMKDKSMKDCMAMKEMKDMDMKGMDMKGMDPQKCNEMMKGMSKPAIKSTSGESHATTAVVKSVDSAKGMVTLAHEPIKSLGWPAMTMAFAVKDKSLMDKLTVGKKVHVDLKKQDKDYVVTAVK